MPIPQSQSQTKIRTREVEPTYYEILNLTDPLSSLSLRPDPPTIRKAYHQALLLHHPDKSPLQDDGEDSNPKNTVESAGEHRYTISQIQLAYNTLIDPVRRREYDQTLLLRRFGSDTNTEIGYDGWEKVDLDEFEYNPPPPPPSPLNESIRQRHDDKNMGNSEIGKLESLKAMPETATWTRRCRCGDPLGFVITETDLEKEIAAENSMGFGQEYREILVGCHGCSLVIRVAFAVSQ